MYIVYKQLVNFSAFTVNWNVTEQPCPLFLIYTAPGPVSNIMVTANENGTAANITWMAAPLSDSNTLVAYRVNVYDSSGNVVFNITGIATTVSVTQGLGKD